MRSLLAGVLLLVGALLVPVATTGWWLRTDLLATGGYVETVTPLATDPAMVSAVEHVLFDATMRAVDSSDLVSHVDQALADRGVPADSLLDLHHLTGSTESRVRVLVRRAVHAVVTSPRFVTVWRSANRVAHDEAIAVLDGRSSVLEQGPGSTVDVRLDALSTPLKRAMAEAGIPFAGSLPRLSASYPLGSVHDLRRARTVYAELQTATVVAPAVTVALLAVGLLVARRRRPALVVTAFVALVGLGLALAVLLAARSLYPDAVPAQVPLDAARAAFGAITAGFRRDLGAVALAVVVVTGVALLLPRRSDEPRQELIG